MRDVRLVNPSTLHKPNGYTHVAEITSGKLVYVAGQVALDTEGRLAGKDDLAAQAQQVFTNLREGLTAAGGKFADVVKLNIYCADRVDRGQLNVIRAMRDRFVNTQAPPVSTLVFVSSLVHPDWLIEIEAIAVI